MHQIYLPTKLNPDRTWKYSWVDCKIIGHIFDTSTGFKLVNVKLADGTILNGCCLLIIRERLTS